MKTKGGYKIINFKAVKEPRTDPETFEPYIFEGDVDLTSNWEGRIMTVFWDKYGRCGNFSRTDVFIDVEEILKEKINEIIEEESK